MTSRRRLSVIYAVVILVLPFAAVQACGPDWTPDTFVRSSAPDDAKAFASGHLGILQTGFDSNDLAVAYRYLNGGQLSDRERLAYAPAQQPVRDWTKATAEQVQAAREAERAAQPVNAWRILRAKYLPQESQASSKPPLPENYGEWDSIYDPESHRCPDPAFETATLTLNHRAASWGTQSPWLVNWIHAQDAVFSNCTGKSPATPSAVPDGSPQLLQADRAYQNAAAAFYAGRFGEAREQFDAIAQDRNSPWRYLGRYLAARSLVRNAFALASKTDPWSGETATFDQKTMQEAQNLLESLLNDHDPALSRQAILNELNFVRIRTEPQKRISEICAALEGPAADDNFDQDLKDLNYILVKHIEIKAPPPLLAWIQSFRATSLSTTDVSNWQSSHALPSMVLAIVKASPSDAIVHDLLAAAAQIKPSAPAFDTVTFHRIRLLIGLNRASDARALLDQVLSGLRRDPPSSALNAFRAQRMTVARNFAEFLSYTPRALLESNSQGSFSLVLACRGGEFDHGPYNCPAPDRPMAFDEDAALVFNRQTPLAMLVEAASSPTLPPNLRQDLVLATWTRSVLLGDEADAAKLSPHLPDSIRKTAGTSIAFPAILAILRNPGLRPFLEPGISHLVTFNYLDHFRNNWWCSSWYGQFTRDPWTAKEPEPVAFLTQDQQSTANAEYQRLRKLPCAPSYLGTRVLDYAKSNPADPDIPEALALTVRATHYACLEWSTDSTNAAQNTAVSKAAFQLLHSRYPNSAWTARTRYYY